MRSKIEAICSYFVCSNHGALILEDSSDARKTEVAGLGEAVMLPVGFQGSILDLCVLCTSLSLEEKLCIPSMQQEDWQETELLAIKCLCK